MTDIVSHGAANFGYSTAELKIGKGHKNKRERISRRGPRDGKANLALIDLLARHFGIAKSTITILRGHSARRKIIELLK